MAKAKTFEIKQVGLRLRESLRAQMEKAAARTGLSMNEEIVRRLEWSLDNDALYHRMDKQMADAFGGDDAFENAIGRASMRRALEKQGIWTDLGNDPMTERVLRAFLAQWYWHVGDGARTRVESVMAALADVESAIDQGPKKARKSQ